MANCLDFGYDHEHDTPETVIYGGVSADGTIHVGKNTNDGHFHALLNFTTPTDIYSPTGSASSTVCVDSSDKVWWVETLDFSTYTLMRCNLDGSSVTSVATVTGMSAGTFEIPVLRYDPTADRFCFAFSTAPDRGIWTMTKTGVATKRYAQSNPWQLGWGVVVANDGGMWARFQNTSTDDQIVVRVDGTTFAATTIAGTPFTSRFRVAVASGSGGGVIAMDGSNTLLYVPGITSSASTCTLDNINAFSSFGYAYSSPDFTTVYFAAGNNCPAYGLIWLRVNAVTPQHFSLARASARNSLLNHPCVYGDAKTAFHYGTALFPNPEIAFSSPNAYTYNWSVQLGGTNRILTVYTSGTAAFAQVLQVDTSGITTYGTPVAMAGSNAVTEGSLVSIDQSTAVFCYKNAGGNLEMQVVKCTAGTTKVFGFGPTNDTGINGNRVSAATMGGTDLVVAVTDDLTGGIYPVKVVPVTVNLGAGNSTTAGSPVTAGDSGVGFTYGPRIVSLTNTKFLLRWANSGGSRFRAGLLTGNSVSLAATDQVFAWDSQDHLLLGVGPGRAINGSIEGGFLQIRVVDVSSTNVITTANPFHTETSNLPSDNYSTATLATARTALIAWNLSVGVRVCHIAFPFDGSLATKGQEQRLFQRENV